MTEIDAGYGRQVLDYEKTAFDAAQGGDYAGAAQTWSAILNDASMRSVFEQDADALKELAWNLAAALGASGQVQQGQAIVEQYGLDASAYAEAFGAAQS